MYKSAPIAPLSTVGIALHIAAASVIQTASVGLSPRITTPDAADHVPTVTMSESQYIANVVPVQVRFSMGTGSWSEYRT